MLSLSQSNRNPIIGFVGKNFLARNENSQKKKGEKKKKNEFIRNQFNLHCNFFLAIFTNFPFSR